MKKEEKSIKTQRVEKLAEFFGIGTTAIYNQLREETKLSNVHTKKAYSNLCNGLPYYDMNAIVYEVCKKVADCRFTCEWEIREYEPNKYKIRQGLDCWCNGRNYFTKVSGIEGINDILNQIGFNVRLEEPKNFLELVVWK